MGRFGPTLARFYAPGNITTPLNVGGTMHQAVSGWFDDHDSGLGEAGLIFVNNSNLNSLAATGNICWAVKTDSMRSDLSGNEVTFAEPFIIRERVTIPGTDMIEIRGPLLTAELNRWTIYRPLGHETLGNTTILAGHPVAGPDTSRILEVGAPPGVNSFQVNTASDADVGRELRVQMNNSLWFVTEIHEIRLWEGNKHLACRDRIPVAADAGNDIEIRERRIRVTNPANFKTGAEIHITLNSGTHSTLIEEGPSGESGDIIILRDGCSGAANAGNAVQAKDYSLPTTNDVTLIMAFAQGWAVEFETGTGTASPGTRYPGGGETVHDILRSIVTETGEQFRLKSAEASPTGPKRRIVWRRTTDSAGVSGTVRLVMPSQANMAADTANVNRAILIERPRHAGNYDPVTQIIPVAGDAKVTLFACSEAAKSAAAAAGFNVVTTGLGLYAAPYIVNTALNTSIGVWQRRVVFSEVTVEGDHTGSITAAADRLLSLAINYLREHTDTAREITARCISPIGIRPGQRVELVFDAPTGEYSINYTNPNYLYVQAVRRETSPDGDYPGAPITTLTLTPTRAVMPSANREIGRRLASVERLATKVSAPQLINMATALGSGSGTGTPIPPPVAGVYLPLAGGTMTGNIGFSGSQTVDGVDISAHAANPSAHHAPVTAANQTIDVAGQAISVPLHPNFGVTLVFGGGTGLGILRPPHSGLAVDSTGLYLNPSTLTAAATNAVSGTGHTHAITAADNTVAAGAAILLKSTATGGLSLDKLGVGIVGEASAALTVRARATNNYGLWIKQLASQTFDIWRVDDSAGNPLLRMTGAGHFESGTPAFVSGQVGWRIWGGTLSGDAEFNNVRVRGELHASVFVADEMHAVGGTVLVKTATKVGAPRAGQPNDNKLPAINSTFSLIVDASWDGGLNYLPVGSILRIKPMGEIASGGSLDLYDIYLQVTTAGSIQGRDLANGQPGYFVLTCNRRLGGDTNFIIPPGTAVVKWTLVAPGDPEGAVKITGDGDGGAGPFMDIFTVNRAANASWGGVPPTVTPRVRVGNLSGVLGGARGTWGIAAGTDLSNANSTTAQYFAASDTGLWLHNVGVRIFSGSDQTVDITSSGALKLGTNVTNDATTGFSYNPATGNVRLGPQASGKANAFWNDSAGSLSLRQNTTDVIVLPASGDSYFDNPLKLGSGGGIWQGTGGSFASPQGGLKIWNTSGAGRLAQFDSGGVQRITMRHDRGIEIAGTAISNTAAITFANTAGGTVYGGLYTWHSGGVGNTRLQIDTSTQLSYFGLDSKVNGNVVARIQSGATGLILDSETQYALLTDADFYVRERGLAVGYTTTPNLNRGVIASDLAGAHDNPSIILQDTTDVAHGMTTIASTGTFGNLHKLIAASGGLLIRGLTEDVVGVHMAGYGTNGNSDTNTGASGAIHLTAFKRSGTGTTAYGNDENILVVRNVSNARFIVKGDGRIFSDAAAGTYDEYVDAELVRAVTLARNPVGLIRSEFDKWVRYNRDDLERLDLIGDGGFVNITGMQELHNGVIWQQHRQIMELGSRVKQLEERYGHN